MEPNFVARNPDFEAVVRESFARQPMMTTLGAGLVRVARGGRQAADEAAKVEDTADGGPGAGDEGQQGQEDEDRPVGVAARGKDRVVHGPEPVLRSEDGIVRDESAQGSQSEEPQAFEGRTRGEAVAGHPGKIRDTA